MVQDKLLDGVALEEAAPVQTPVAMPATQPDHAQTETDDESREHRFLRIFLSGGDWKQYLRDIHMPEGVMVENINNEMMDAIGDIVLEDNGDGLQLIEDYRKEVEEML